MGFVFYCLLIIYSIKQSNQCTEREVLEREVVGNTQLSLCYIFDFDFMIPITTYFMESLSQS